LNCTKKKDETHNVGSCLWDNYFDQFWGSTGGTPRHIWTAQHRKLKLTMYIWSYLQR